MSTRGFPKSRSFLYFRKTYNSLFGVTLKFFLGSKSQPRYHKNPRGWEGTKQLWHIPRHDFLTCSIKYVGRIWWIRIFCINLVEDRRTVYVIEDAVLWIGGIGTEWAIDIDFWPVWEQHGNAERELFVKGCNWLIPFNTLIETNHPIGANLQNNFRLIKLFPNIDLVSCGHKVTEK